MGHRFGLAALLLAIGCKADDGYGIVQLQLQGSEAVFDGTDRITVSVEYLECLAQFYDDNPDETQEGGSGVFDEWKDRLCDSGIDSAIDCDVASLEQAGTGRLTIAFDVRGDVGGRRLALGPLPDAETADCTGGTSPEIRLASTSAVVGRAGSTSIWHSDTFSATGAVVDQGAPLVVDVVAN